jgi:hypothetical protein
VAALALPAPAPASEPPPPKGLPETPRLRRPEHARGSPAGRANPALAVLGFERAFEAGFRGRGVVVAFWSPFASEPTVSCDAPEVRPALVVHAAEDRNGNGRFDPADENGVDDDGNGCVDDVHGCRFTPGGSDGRVCAAHGLGHDARVVGYAVGREGGPGPVGLAPEARALLVAGELHGPADLARVFDYLERAGARVLVSAIAAGVPLRSDAECESAARTAHPDGPALLRRPGAPVWLLGFPDRYPMCDAEGISIVGVYADDRAIVGNARPSVPNPFVDLAVTGETDDSRAQSWALAITAGVLADLFQQRPHATRRELLERLCRTAVKVGPLPYDGRHPLFPDVSWNSTYGCGRVDLPKALGLADPR